jgi:tRNA(fMet)-specific endonuclease VapC
MNKILIDTNIYSLAMRGDSTVIDILQQSSQIGITSISMGELLSGFKGGSKEMENRKELNQFLDSPRVTFYAIDAESAEYYSAILNQLKKQGTPIPTNDIWIAAVAFQQGLQMVTNDKHFSYIDGLLLDQV